ncbi:4018_t:CDS:2, partial [Dentiscutata heterogama]
MSNRTVLDHINGDGDGITYSLTPASDQILLTAESSNKLCLGNFVDDGTQWSFPSANYNSNDFGP